MPGNPGTTETPAPPPSDPGLDPSASSGGGTSSGGGSAGSVTVDQAFLDTDGTTLALVGVGGVCAEYSGVVDEAPDAVKVQIVGRSTLAPDMACIEIAAPREVDQA